MNSAPCSVADNRLITNVPVLQFVRRQQPGQKPWWAVWGVNKKKRRKDEIGRQKDMDADGEHSEKNRETVKR